MLKLIRNTFQMMAECCRKQNKMVDSLNFLREAFELKKKSAWKHLQRDAFSLAINWNALTEFKTGGVEHTNV